MLGHGGLPSKGECSYKIMHPGVRAPWCSTYVNLLSLHDRGLLPSNNRVLAPGPKAYPLAKRAAACTPQTSHGSYRSSKSGHVPDPWAVARAQATGEHGGSRAEGPSLEEATNGAPGITTSSKKLRT